MELSGVSYHTRELLKLDCIEVVGKEQIRGALKTKYRATTKMLLDTEHWNKLTKETRTGISINAVNEVIERASDAIAKGTFDKRKDRSVISLKMDVDEQAWDEINEIVRDAYERVCAVESQAANRKGTKFRATVSLLSYESPQDEAPQARAA